jgi:4-diphosphocytidyl-2-C-methyl-D-erythritol kinase
MFSERHADTVLVRAPAKVNLFLEVLGRRPDGYHEIATLMVAVSLYDTLELKEEATGQVRLTCDQPTLSIGPENLVCRAAEVLRRHTSSTRGADIRLIKRIPVAAGLAGGSTDAAATLAGLNRLWQLGLPLSELAAIGAEVGSDVPFFLTTPAAWCTGRGEKTTPWPLGRTLHLVLVCPSIGLSTADVYRGVTIPERPESGDEIRQAAADGNMEEIGRRLHNRLQPAAERLCPPIAACRNRLAQLGAAGQMMSGSGTSVFALCRDYAEALRAALSLRAADEEAATGPETGGAQVFVVQSCS